VDVNQLIGCHQIGFAVQDLPNRSRANHVDVVPDGLRHHHARGKIVSSAKERHVDLLVIQIDGIHMDEDMTLVAAIGVDAKGDKHPLGLAEG
jgi:hypothetical protein